MLRDKRFWVGFFLGYLLVALVPSANLLGALKGKGA